VTTDIQDPREENLPKWVRDKILVLRIKIKDQSDALDIANRRAQDGSSGVVIADDLGHNGFPLNDRAQVTFHLPGGKVSVMLRENGTVLDINGSGSICVMPRASNCAYVKFDKNGRL
jgi:hypothetical protein